MSSIKQERDVLVESEINIKTEPYESDTECSINKYTSYENSSLNIKLETDEPTIEVKYDELKNDPLDVCDDIKGEADPETINHVNQDNKECLLKLDQDKTDKNNSGNQRNQPLASKKQIDKKEYICDVCNKTFWHKLLLEHHYRNHVGEKPFICKACNKSFRRNCDLTKHMIIHSEERPYVCDICKKGFNHITSLRTHKYCHVGDKLYTCDFCNKSYTRKSYLKIHRRLHTDKEPYSCHICFETFTEKKDLINHKSVHKN